MLYAGLCIKILAMNPNNAMSTLPISRYINYCQVSTLAAFQWYFRWAGFRDYDLCLNIVETDPAFKPLPGRSFYVDFLTLTFPTTKEECRAGGHSSA